MEHLLKTPIGQAGAFDLLICDCDGVLVDSEVVADRVLLEIAREFFPGEPIEAVLANAFGTQTDVLLGRLANHLGKPLPPAFRPRLREQFAVALKNEVEPVAGLRAALERVDLTVAVVSNSEEARIKGSVARAGVADLVGDRVFSADHVARPKPAPDVYLLAARSLGIDPARCIAVEDSGPGVTAALAAGMTAIGFVGGSHIPAGHARRLADLGAGPVLESMAQLPAAVAALRFPTEGR
jgi:HAD superfamily hydrolase (TIGR01509 family)